MQALTRSERAALAVIQQHEQATRATVAAALSLSAAMTTRVVTRLQEVGLVRETNRVPTPGRGRQALLLEIDPTAAHVVALDIGTDLIHLLVTDARGNPSTSDELPSSILSGKPQTEIITMLASFIWKAAARAGVPGNIAAAGIAVTGIIDSDAGVCLARSHTPGWDNFAITAPLGGILNVPVVLEDSARAKAIAERRCGNARGIADFLYVDAGASIGAGIMIGDKPLRGVGGLAGELGHITVDPDGAFCRCGNRGCVQTCASAPALINRAHEILRHGVYSTLADRAGALTLDDIAVATAAGDKLALTLLTEAGERLGEAISVALNLLGLDLVVLGGSVVDCSPLVLEAAQRIVQLRVLPIVPKARRLVTSALGRDAAARGVALQAIDCLFDAGLSGMRYNGTRRHGAVMAL